MEKVVFAIGRWMPIHLGHKEFLLDLIKKFDKVIIGIGSCYESNTPRNCIPMVMREKLLRKVLKEAKVEEEKIKIIPVLDRVTFEEWIDNVVELCKENHVTHFCTGNKEDIINVLEEKGIDLNLEIINPEEDSKFPYHSTDIRKMIMNGEYSKLSEVIPIETMDLMVKYISKMIINSNQNNSADYLPDWQNVRLALIIKNNEDNKNYVLINKNKKFNYIDDSVYPGGRINKFELSIEALSRTVFEETGIKILVKDNSEEPAKAEVSYKDYSFEADLNFLGIYYPKNKAYKDVKFGGTQMFEIMLDDAKFNINEKIGDYEFVAIDNFK